MLRIFISSTQRDLSNARKALHDELKRKVSVVAMEIFVPDGRTSQEIALDKKTGLRNCNIVIFLISPYYGSLIDECKIADCSADCPMRVQNSQGISYTHCEYKVALSEGILMQPYLVKNGWDILSKMQTWDEIRWDQIREDRIFEDYTDAEIEHYFQVRHHALELKREVHRPLIPRISLEEENISKCVSKISSDLAKNIVTWYSEGKLQLDNFCGRKSELINLIKKMEETVEVHGIGGVGKTSLIQIALIIQMLNGKEVVVIAKRQSYYSGSGYHFFKDKMKSVYYEAIGDVITINDVYQAIFRPSDNKSGYEITPEPDSDAFEHLNCSEPIPDRPKITAAVLERLPESEEARLIVERLNKGNLLLFIDDYHLADESVMELLKEAKGIVVSSRTCTGTARNEIPLEGILESDRDALFEVLMLRFDATIDDTTKEKIKHICEGHPVTMELLIRNSTRIDFTNFEHFGRDAISAIRSRHVEDFYRRLVNEILSEDALKLIKNLSILNTDIEGNIDRRIVENTYGYTACFERFNELLDTGLLLKKKESKKGYAFTYKHVQEALLDAAPSNHSLAIKYYDNVIKVNANTPDYYVERLWHELHSKEHSKSALVEHFIQLAGIIPPTQKKAFKRLIEIGEALNSE